jgi:hypothetical protein
LPIYASISLSFLELDMETGIAIHPYLLEDVVRMAEILGVEQALIPTEVKISL